MRNRKKPVFARTFWNPFSSRGGTHERTPMHRRITAAVASIAMLMHTLVPSYAQSVVVDPTRPGNAPGVTAAPNGVPVVNIVAPNGAGLSHNRFTRFNVGPNGLILNNSTSFGRSQLGGMIVGNPNLQGSGAARKILGEVTGGSRSTLQGMTEVFGAPADWVLVNANGITCNGCGFINIPRATLSTGVPVFDGAGGLAGLSVNRGTVTIGANGVNAVGTDYFDIVARAIEINGEISGKETGEIGLFSDRNDFDLATRQAIAKADDGSPKPTFGIDSSAVGGMYAGRITMVGTEAGVGVKAPTIGAGSGGVRLDSNGNLVLRKTTSRGNLNARAAQKVEAKGNIYAEAALTLRAGGDIEIFTGAVTGAAGDVLLEGTNIVAGGQVLAAGLAADGTITAGTGALTVTATNDFTVAAGSTVAAGGNIATSRATRLINNATFSANGSIGINAAGLTNNGVMAADGDLTLTLSADLANAVDARLVAVGDTNITASSIANSGTIAADAALNVVSASTITNDGLISATTLSTITATDALTNDRTIQSLAALDVTAASVANNGTIAGNGPLTVSTTGTLSNGAVAEIKSGSTVSLTAGDLQASGLIESAGAMTLIAASATLSGDVYSAADAALLVTGAASLTATGNLVAGNDLTIGAGSLTNEGALGSQRDLTITTTGDLANKGSILVERNATITAGGALTQSATARLAANGTLGVTADRFENAGVAEAGEALTISTATALTNSGRIEGFDRLAINDPMGGAVTSNVTNSGTVRGASDLKLWATNLDNTGALESGGDITLTVSGALTSDAATSLISATNDLTIAAADFTQSNLAVAGNDVIVDLTGAYTSRAGAQLSAGNALTLSADTITNEGAISGNTGAALTASTLTNKSGATIQTLGGQLTLRADMLTNAGALASGGTLLASADTLHNDGGLIVSVDDLELRGRTSSKADQIINREGGVIETFGGGDITIRAEFFQNRSTVTIAAGARQSFDNLYIPNMNTPIWVPVPYGCIPCWEQMVGDTPSGHIIIPHPDEIARILELRGATADQWDPEWWKIYAPTHAGEWDSTTWSASTVTIGTIGETGSALPISDLTPLSPGTTPFGALAGPLAFNSAEDLGLGAAFQYFTPAPGASPYLYETRFQFIDAGLFFGTGYFLDLMGVSDLSTLPKRLGDAYFDTRLVNDQIFRTTGRRWLDIGVPDERAQMQALIDAAASQSAGLQLTPGVSLTADQIARLTADIVWYETITIDGQEVLAPRLYLSPTSLENRNPSGALIVAGGDVSLTGASVTNTRGTIEGGGVVSLVSLTGDIANRSGRIIGGDVSLVSAGSIINERLTTTTGNGTNRIGTIVDREALIAATGTGAGTGGNITLQAQDTVAIRAATVAGAGDVTIDATQIEITAVETYSLDEHGDTDNTGYRNEERRNLGSTIFAGGNFSANAGETIDITGSDVTAIGDSSLIAGGEITIAAAENSSSYTSAQRKSGLLSKSFVREQRDSTQLQSSTITFGGDGTIKAGTDGPADLNIVASNVLIDGDGEVSASRDVNLLEGREEFYSDSVRRKSGLFAEAGGGSITAGYRKTSDIVNQQGSTGVTSVLAFGGDGTVTAGRDINSNAATIGVGEALTLEAARDVNLNSVTDVFRSNESHKSLEIAATASVFENVTGPLKALADTPRMATSGKGNVGHKAVSAISAGLKAADAAKDLAAVVTGASPAAGVNVSVDISSSKETSQQTANVSRSGFVSAGDKLTINAGRDLVSQGAVIIADSAEINVGRDATLTSARSTSQWSSESSSSGASVGVSVGVGVTGAVVVTPTASVSASKGSGSGQSVTHSNTIVDVAGNLDLNVGNDAALRGAEVYAGSADVDVGGDLLVESQLDVVTSQSSEAGGSLSLGESTTYNAPNPKNNGSSGPSLSVSVHGSKSEQDTAWVNGQSGIITDGELDVVVDGDTTVIGGVIGSGTGDLTLETETLTTQDLALKDDASSIEGGVYLSLGSGGVSGSVEGEYANREVDGIARATIGEGEVTIRDADGDGEAGTEADEAAQEEQLASLNRDLDKALEVTEAPQDQMRSSCPGWGPRCSSFPGQFSA